MPILTDVISKEVDLYFNRGTTYTKQFILTDNTGAVLNLTGYTIESKFNEYYGSSLDLGLGVEIINPSTGLIQISMSENLTEVLLKPRYVYEIRLRGESFVVKVLHGQILTEDVTGGLTVLSSEQITVTPPVTGGEVAATPVIFDIVGTPEVPIIMSSYSGAIYYGGTPITGKVTSNCTINGLNIPTSGLTSIGITDLVWTAIDLELNSWYNLTSISLPELVGVGDDFRVQTNPNLTSISVPKLKYVSYLGFNDNKVSTLNFEALEIVQNSFSIYNNSYITTLSTPLLQQVGTYIVSGSPLLTLLSVPCLQARIGIQITNNIGLTSISFPNVVKVGQFYVNNCPALTTINLNAIKTITDSFTVSGFTVPSALTNSLLAKLVSLDGTNGTTPYINSINIDGVPTEQGIIDKATLITRGCSVNTL